MQRITDNVYRIEKKIIVNSSYTRRLGVLLNLILCVLGGQVEIPSGSYRIISL